MALSEAGPTPAAFWRFSYGLPLLAALCLIRPRGRRALSEPGWLVPALASGVFFAADIVLWHNAIELIGAGPSTLVVNTQVVWLALLGLFLLGERPAPAFWLALPVIGVGLWLLSGGSANATVGAGDAVGVVIGLAGGVCYAVSLFLVRRSQRAAPVLPEATLVAQLCVGWVLVGAFGLLEGSLPAELDARQHGWLLLLGVGAQALSWIAITAGIRRLPGHHGGLLLLVQPVSSLLLGWQILGQALSAGRLLGAALILCGIGAALMGERAPRR